MAHLVMCVYTAFYLGRIHELFEVLRPLRLVLLFGVLGVVLALALPPDRRNRVLRQPEVRLVLGMTAIAVLFAPFSAWPGGTWSFLLDTYSRAIIFLLLVVALATSTRVVKSLVWSVLVGIALLGLFTITGGSEKLYAGRAFASTTYDPNDVAMMMVCTLPLAVFAGLALHGVRRVLAFGVACICVLATIMTMSRGGFIGLVFVSVVLLFRLGRASLAPRILILVTVGAFLAGAAPAKYWDLMATIWSPTSGGEYVEGGILPRIELWKRGINLFLSDPVTGAGAGMYEVAEGLSHGGRGKWSAAHNSFIQIGTELGLAGLALFVALLALGLRNARRTIRAAGARARTQDIAWVARAVETALYAYVVEGFALSQAYSPMLYFLLGISVALRLLVARRPAPATVPARAVPAPRALRPSLAP
ncbi:MAG TPA: O-antigen ligase family protein [Methylomirabilota bacterium]|nr:O-antigen ligase family protein [Methylomirabilota bacterium]